ncbi:vacuolar protein sorting-associated protein 41 homolog [Oppia nitens]|uniref:vacuolar protein sorting-associated protein 41 homolog n=1 Tax=Oppia nitens TaxID=1686743 RepID=UPI0023DA1FD6|nr:vacuolar protein sorting-associated protein 41 homolog [Oppia nitens]
MDQLLETSTTTTTSSTTTTLETDQISDDSDEEVEPKLTYERITNDVTAILKKESATCLAVHSKFIALATHLGKINIIDVLGNRVNDRELCLHKTSINQISIDEKGEYLASSSDDRIVIIGLYSSDNNYHNTFDRPIRAIAIDPYFRKRQRFVVGEGDKIVLYEKTFLSRYRPIILQQSKGQIRNIRWRTQFIAWASDLCVKIYDIEDKAVITYIERDKDNDLQRFRPELFKCHFCWKDDKTLLIGWADTIKICCIKQKPNNELPRRYVQLTASLNVGFGVCGIAPIESKLVVLCVNKEANQLDNTFNCRVEVIEPIGTDGYEEISSDILSPKSFNNCRSSDYHVDCLPEEGLYLILCPKDLIIAKPREEDDHITWLLEHQQYEEALKVVENNNNNKNIRKHTVLSVGSVYLKSLLDESPTNHSQYEKAAKLCCQICGTDKTAWENQVMRFKRIGQLRVMAPYLPRGPELILDPAIYEIVLKEFLELDSKGFLQTIRQWNPNIYSISTIVKATLGVLTIDPKNRNLLEALAELYSHDGKHDKALTIYKDIGNKVQVFDLIRKYGLYAKLQEQMEVFFQLNSEETAKLLIENQEIIPAELVVKQLRPKPQLLFVYLDQLVAHKDSEVCSAHHGLLVQLYAQYSPDKLMAFLRSSNYYELETALEVCRKKNLFNEVVFLLGRMGNTKEALQLITDKLNDINYAIEFCKEHSDSELWEDLIRYSMNKPRFIRVLLQNIGTHMADPIALIHRIPEGLKIDGLMQALVRILQDYNLQTELEDGCRRVLVSDCYSLLQKLNRVHKRGLLVDEDYICHGCQRKVFAREIRYASDIIVFNCRHVFHETCLLTTTGEFVCLICSAQERSEFKIS